MTSPGQAGQAIGAPPPRQAPENPPAAPQPAATAPAEAAPETAAPAAAAQPAQAAPAAAPPALGAAAVPPVPGGPAPAGGPMTGGRPPERPAWRARRHRRLHRLRIGQHVATDQALDQMHLTSASFGLLVGWNQAGGPVALPLFQPEPTRVMLVGGSWAAQLLTFRSLSFGARLVVFTDDPAGWIALGRRATGRTDRVAVLQPGAPVRTVASADRPVLQLIPDAAGGSPPPGAAAPVPTPGTAPVSTPGTAPVSTPPAPTGTPPATAGTPQPPGNPVSPAAPVGAQPAPDAHVPPWTTRLSVLPQISPDRSPLLGAASVVLTQRLSPAEAAVLAPALRLTERTAYTLQVLHDDMLAILTPAGAQYAWVYPTSTELHALGQPSRY